MPSSYEDAERKVVAALLMDWHRSGDRLLGAEDLRLLFNAAVDPKLFEAIVADLDRRGIVLAFYDKDGASALLKPEGYKEAAAIVSQELGNPATFHIDWRKEEIATEAPTADWFPVPEGWKWLQLAGIRPAAPVSEKREEHEPRVVDWQKWGVIVAVISLFVTAVLAIAVH